MVAGTGLAVGTRSYRSKLGFSLVADVALGEAERWVEVAPAGGGPALALGHAAPQLSAGGSSAQSRRTPATRRTGRGTTGGGGRLSG